MGSITSVEGYRQSHVNFGLEFENVVSPNSKQKGCPRNEDVKVRYNNHPTGATAPFPTTKRAIGMPFVRLERKMPGEF